MRNKINGDESEMSVLSGKLDLINPIRRASDSNVFTNFEKLMIDCDALALIKTVLTKSLTSINRDIYIYIYLRGCKV